METNKNVEKFQDRIQLSRFVNKFLRQYSVYWEFVK